MMDRLGPVATRRFRAVPDRRGVPSSPSGPQDGQCLPGRAMATRPKRPRRLTTREPASKHRSANRGRRRRGGVLHVRTHGVHVRLLGKALGVCLDQNVACTGLAMSPCRAVVRFDPGLAAVECARSVWGCLLCVHVRTDQDCWLAVIRVWRSPMAVARAPAESLLSGFSRRARGVAAHGRLSSGGRQESTYSCGP
jgi:hypothetical protein